MSLIKCQECGKEISDKATACPNCGCPLVPPQNPNTSSESKESKQPMKVKKNSAKGCLWAFIIVIGVPVIVSIFAKLMSGEPLVKNSPATTAEVTTTPVLTKDEAKIMDEDIWNYVYPVILANNNLMNTLNAYSNNELSELDLYNTTKDFYEYTQSMWENPPDITDPDGEQYLDSCQDYIIIEQTMADSLLKYLDSKKTSDLSNVQDNIERCTEAVKIVASNRGTFLGINNFTDEEIQQIIAETME